MKVWSPIFNLIAVMLIAYILIVFGKIEETNRRQFEEVRLSYAVDYATEAAFRSAIDTDSINTDYLDDGLEEVRVNPVLILDTFCNIMCFSYDMSPGLENFDSIKASIATSVLFTIDGYYVLEATEKDRTPTDPIIGLDYDLDWGVKRPYLVYSDDGSRLFAAYLVGEKTIEYIPDDDQYKGNIYDYTYGYEGENPALTYRKFYDEKDTYSKRGTGLTKEKVKQAISSLVTEDMNYAIHTRNVASVNKIMRSFYLPANDSLTAVNDVISPSLIVLFQDSTFLNGYDMDVTAVGGTRVKVRSNIIGFYYKGREYEGSYYCYAGQQLGEPDLDIIEVTKRFDTMHEAAMTIDPNTNTKYSPHFEFLSKPLGKGANILLGS